MSSWANRNVVRPQTQIGDMGPFFQTSMAGFCSNFNEFVLAYLYCKRKGIPFQVVDKPNCVSLNHSLLEPILKIHPDITYLKQCPEVGKLQRSDMLKDTSFTAEEFQTAAKTIFQLNKDTDMKIAEFFKSRKFPLQTKFDVGLHIRSGDKITKGEMKAIPLETYVQALEQVAKKLKKTTLNVFVMTDNTTVFQKLSAKLPRTWTLYTLQEEYIYTRTGHSQGTFNLLSTRIRNESYIQFLAELEIMKRLPHLVVTFSSNIGRWLYITNQVAAKDDIVSLDEEVWNFF